METCEHCGAKMVTYKHKMNKGLCKGLIVLDRHGGKAKLAELTELNYNQRNNFQKLQYWNLIVKNIETKEWTMTTWGKDFLLGKVAVQKNALTYRNELQGFEGETITIQDALEDHAWWWRENYLENSQ